MLEAGKKLPIEQELRSMEWPYNNAHRGELPPDRHALTFNEYTIRNPPYGPGFEKSKHLHSYIGNSDYVKNIVVDERENPFTGTNYAWVRARCLGGKTNIWGRLALAAFRLRFQGQEPRRFRRRLAHQLQRPRSLLRQGGPVPRHHRREGKSSPPSRQHISASHKTELRRSHASAKPAKDGPRPHPVPCRRHHRRAEAQQVSQPLLRTRRL